MAYFFGLRCRNMYIRAYLYPETILYPYTKLCLFNVHVPKS